MALDCGRRRGWEGIGGNSGGEEEWNGFGVSHPKSTSTAPFTPCSHDWATSSTARSTYEEKWGGEKEDARLECLQLSIRNIKAYTAPLDLDIGVQARIFLAIVLLIRSLYLGPIRNGHDDICVPA